MGQMGYVLSKILSNMKLLQIGVVDELGLLKFLCKITQSVTLGLMQRLEALKTMKSYISPNVVMQVQYTFKYGYQYDFF